MITKDEYHKKYSEFAKEAFGKHTYKEIGPGHWVVFIPNDSHFRAHIVVMDNIAISVWGDIDQCTFAYCGGAKSPEAVVAWMARADIDYYGKQKASIGMGNIGVDDYDCDVAIADLRYYLNEIQDENYYGDEETNIACVGFIANAIDELEYSDGIQQIAEKLYESISGFDADAHEWIFKIGKVTSIRVIYALAAISRLHELLMEQAPEGR